MGASLVVISSGGLQDSAQVSLAEHDDVIEKFAPD